MKTIVGAAIGECVHVAGVSNFLRLAKQLGWRVVFLGPATPLEKVIASAREEQADLVGVSYRLTPENGERLLAEFAEAADHLRNQGVRFAFGGTPPVVDKVEKLNFFEVCFDGTETAEDVIAYLKGQDISTLNKKDYPQEFVNRLRWKAPFPLIRHHFGLPTIEQTVKGIRQIAESKLVDVISLGIDQEAQENFFHPDRQDKRRFGAGGVPVRTSEDYRRLYDATRCGNFPLMRTYSGTDDFIRLAEMYVETINIAWAAVPLFWFNQMDGRGPWNLEESIREHQKLMAWYGQHNIPVEANEAHHWGMRDAPDVIYVVSAFIAAYNVREFGVKDHIVQMMFNSPPSTSTTMDLAKMLALIKMVSTLETPNFRIWKQTRTGLLSYPVDIDHARAHLSVTVFNQMMLNPDIVHVVGYPEADHAVSGSEVIESCAMARYSIERAMQSQLNVISMKSIQHRVEELVEESEKLLDAIHQLGENISDSPLSDPVVLAQAVKKGLLDAPQLANNPFAKGNITTRIDSRSACVVVDRITNEMVNEERRIKQLLEGEN